jgi:hypothetical protein
MRILYGATVVLSLLPLSGLAQVICTLGPGAAAYKPSADERPSADAMQLASLANTAGKTICGSHCPEIVLFRNNTAPNLMLMADAGRAKVVYAPQLFTTAYDRHGDAGVVALLAHVIGHALDDAIGAAWISKAWTAELRADAWAGCVLARSKLNASDMQDALAALMEYPSPAHPHWNARLPAIRTGYTQCGGPVPFGRN